MYGLLTVAVAAGACGGGGAGGSDPQSDGSGLQPAQVRVGDGGVSATDTAADGTAAGEHAADGNGPDANGDVPPAPPPPPATARIAVIGDYGVDGNEEAAVAALVTSGSPTPSSRSATTTTRRARPPRSTPTSASTTASSSATTRGSYGAGSAINRFWPVARQPRLGGAPTSSPTSTTSRCPGNERYYDVDLGLVHLYAIDSDPHEPDGNTATSKQAHVAQGPARRLDAPATTSSTSTTRRIRSGEHGSTPRMHWPFEAWGADAVLAGHDHDYERLQVGGIPYFVNGLGGQSSAAGCPIPLPETKFRTTGEHGAMLVTATATGITYDLYSAAGNKLDTLTVDKTCK